MLKQALCSVAVTGRAYYGAICVYIYIYIYPERAINVQQHITILYTHNPQRKPYHIYVSNQNIV